MDSSFNRWCLFFVPEFEVSPAEKCFAEYGDNSEKGTVSLDIFRIDGCEWGIKQGCLEELHKSPWLWSWAELVNDPILVKGYGTVHHSRINPKWIYNKVLCSEVCSHNPTGNPHWSTWFLKDCSLWTGIMLEQVLKNYSPWEGLSLEQFVKDCILWEHSSLEQGR